MGGSWHGKIGKQVQCNKTAWFTVCILLEVALWVVISQTVLTECILRCRGSRFPQKSFTGLGTVSCEKGSVNTQDLLRELLEIFHL